MLDLRAPVVEAVHNEYDLWRALMALSPRPIMLAMSFMTLGIFWAGQQTQLDHLAQSDRNLSWIHIAFLLAVSIMPFSTTLLAQFIVYRVALVEYWANILIPGLVPYGSWGYAVRARLLKKDVPQDVPAAICQPIVIVQSLYAVGALLCVFNTYWSIAFIVLVQLNYAVAPRIRLLSRL